MPKRASLENTGEGWLVGWWRTYSRRRQRLLTRSAAQSRFKLTREGAHLLFIVLFIFVGAVIRDINLLILVATAMIGLLILQWRFGIATITGLSATRRLLERTTEGQSIDCVITVENRKRWLGAWLVIVEDNIHQLAPQPRRLSTKGTAVIDEVPPQGASSATYRIEFHRRGRYRIGPCVLSTRFPLSLGRGWRTENIVQEVIVHPKLGELTPIANSLLHCDREGQSKSSVHAGAHETEFFGLRPWATGDSRRWIHWRTSAKLGELAVKQFDRLQQQQVCVLLELFLAKGDQSQESWTACERAIAFVATLATRSAQLAGFRLSVAIAAAKTITLMNIQSPILVRNLLDELAALQATERPDRSEAVGCMSAPLLANPNLLVVSTRSDQSKLMQTELEKSLGTSVVKRIQIQWLNVGQGDLEPYFTWKPNASNDFAAI